MTSRSIRNRNIGAYHARDMYLSSFFGVIPKSLYIRKYIAAEMSRPNMTISVVMLPIIISQNKNSSMNMALPFLINEFPIYYSVYFSYVKR